MTVFQVEVERRQRATVWVECDERSEALEAAGELAAAKELDWNDDEDEDVTTLTSVDSPANLPGGVSYWTGGGSGDWEVTE